MENAFLRTALGRRVLLVIAVGILLPAAGSIAVTYLQIRDRWSESWTERLSRDSKAVGMDLLERLARAADAFQRAEWEGPDRRSAGAGTSEESLLLAEQRLVRSPRERDALLEGLTRRQRSMLTEGRPILMVRSEDGGPSVLLIQPQHPQRPDGSLRLARVRDHYLWGSVDRRGSREGAVCVLDGQFRMLRCPSPLPTRVVREFAGRRGAGALEPHRWRAEDRETVSVPWSLFLGGTFGSPAWTVVTTQSLDAITAPLSAVALRLGLVAGMALCLAFLVANVEIRRRLEPIRELTAATGRVAGGDLDTRVELQTRDEFESLGRSFNAMTERLRAQFNTLEEVGRIDQQVLAARETQEIARSFLYGAVRGFGCRAAALWISEPELRQRGTAHWVSDWAPTEESLAEVTLPPGELEELEGIDGSRVLEAADPRRAYLPRVAGEEIRWSLFPLRVKGELRGVIGTGDAEPRTAEELRHLRQIADQVSLALANADLLRDLRALSIGTIRALGRTIDALSPWTAGHSERVTDLALDLGRELDLAEERLNELRRAALLHDIGKIGVPVSILDKEGPLTEEERELVRRHPEIGVDILSPIAAFEPLLPVILHHHERFDGGGYPAGLSGEEIPFLARILTIADVYESLTSERPYRGPLSPAEALQVMGGEMRSHFDPRLLERFETTLEAPRRPETRRAIDHRIRLRDTA